MTRTGTIQRWDAARAFGFIRGDGGGAEVFFHVRDWQGSHPPKLGARVRYEEIHVGGKGPRGMAVAPESGTAARPAPARAARPAASARTAPHPAASGGAAWIWLALPVWVAVLATGIVLGRLPAWVAGALLALNAATFAVYMADKAAAQNGTWRTRESTLHLLSLLGGWPGARLAQGLFRHKSSKASFQQTYAATVLLNLALSAGWVFWGASRFAALP